MKTKISERAKAILEELENEIYHLDRDTRDAMEILCSRIQALKGEFA